ncbi:MAG: hypothetical protein ACI4QI_06490 [Candidatus Coproplasma sp.]
MIRRAKHTPAALSKSTSKLTVLDASQSLTRTCLGYCSGADGLRLCPAIGSSAVNSLKADNLYAIDSYYDYTIVLYNDGSNYVMRNGVTEADVYDDLPEGKPFSFAYRDMDGISSHVVVCGKTMIACDLSIKAHLTVSIPSSIYGGVVHCGRLFAVENTHGCKVIWSGLNLLDWEDKIDGAGYIFLNSQLGKIYKLENFGDDILCVREYGFTVIKGLADSRNFRIASSQDSIKLSQKINAGGVLRQKYYFSTADGLYSFDGTSVKREYAASGYLTEVGNVYVLNDGYVYADCTYNGYSCIMRYDERSGTAAYFGVNCSHPFTVEGELYCIYANAFYKMSPDNSDGYRAWCSYPIGGYGRKTLKNLYVESDQTPEINAVCGGVRRKVSGTGRIPVNLSGEDIRIEVYGNSTVKSIIAELEERG